jgi:hypothetical protein
MMGAREWLNQHPNVAIGGGIAVAIAAIGLIVLEIRSTQHRYPTAAPDSYFTVDDGKTFFAATSDNVPPFDYKGQQAVEAHVFQCGNQKFVGYMERFIPKYHDIVVAKGLSSNAEEYGREIKKPGDAKWLPSGDLRTEAKLTEVHCPNGSSDTPQPIDP